MLVIKKPIKKRAYIGFRLSQEMHDKLSKLASKHGLKTSEFIRQLLVHSL